MLGVNPRCAITGIPSDVSVSVSDTVCGPDSSFTASASSSLSMRPAFRTLSVSSAPKLRNGMSATTTASAVARATAPVADAISSTETGSVVSYPSFAFPTLSPTRIMSTPASSTTDAVGASYAVSIVTGSVSSSVLPARRTEFTVGIRRCRWVAVLNVCDAAP